MTAETTADAAAAMASSSGTDEKLETSSTLLGDEQPTEAAPQVDEGE